MMPNAMKAQNKKPLNMPLYDDEPYHFGFILGYNQMLFSLDYKDNFQNIPHDPSELPTNIDGVNDLFYNSHFRVDNINTHITHGFNVGILGNLRLAKHFDLRITPSLSFGERKLTYNIVSLQEEIDGSVNEVRKEYTSTIHSNFVEIPLHVKYRSKRHYNCAAYIIAGANYKIDGVFKKKSENKYENIELNVNSHDIAAEIGAGFDFYTGYFKLGVELKMSYGLLDVAKDKEYMFTSSFDKLRNKGFLLSFTFE